MTINYYVGWTGTPWKTDLMPEPTAPSNYKDPEKIAAAVEEKRVKQQETAGGTPIYGKLESVTVIDDQGDVVFEHIDGEDPTASAGATFVDFLLDTFIFPTEDHHYDLLVGNQPARLIGLEVKTPLKMAAMELFNNPPEAASDIPTRMWYRRTFCVDPFEMVRAGVPDLTLDAALSFLGSTPTPAQSMSHAKALAARELATRTGINSQVTERCLDAAASL